MKKELLKELKRIHRKLVKIPIGRSIKNKKIYNRKTKHKSNIIPKD